MTAQSDEQRGVVRVPGEVRQQLEHHVPRVGVDHRSPAPDEFGDVPVDRPEEPVRQREAGEPDRGHYRSQPHRLRERVVVGHAEQRAADVQRVLDADPLGLRGAPHLAEVVVPQRGRVVPQVTGAVLLPVERVDLLGPPVLGRVLQEVTGDADGDRHDDRLHPDVGLQRTGTHHADAAAAAEPADDEDERHRAVGPAAVDEPGPPALLLRVPLGHDVDAARVHHARSRCHPARRTRCTPPRWTSTRPGSRTR